MLAELHEQPKLPIPLNKLKVAVKYGVSNATSGLASNPTLGVAADALILAGGSFVIGKTTEIIGAEYILASRCSSPETSDKLYSAIQPFEVEINRMGADMRGGNTSPGNIAGGLSTIEEKSHGCISKCVTAPIQDVIAYAEHIHGLYFMDSPGNDI